MIAHVCQHCHAHDSVKHVTICDCCGLVIDKTPSLTINGENHKQGHFHKSCTPDFLVMVSPTSAKCELCGAVSHVLESLQHDLKLHGSKVPA